MFKQSTTSAVNFINSIFVKFVIILSIPLVSEGRRSLLITAEPPRFGELFIRLKFSRIVFVALLISAFAFNYSNAQNVSVTGAISGNGNYTTLSAAFNAINGGSQSGAFINVTINSGTNEPVTGAVLLEGAWTSLTIQGFATVSGTINAGTPLIDLNGADRVTINGSNILTFSNSNTSSLSNTGTIRLRNDASNNTISGCRIYGSSTVSLGVSGGTVFFGNGLITGNDNNIISNCDIASASGFPTMAVHFGGTSAIDNSNNLISNCNIYDYFSATAPSCGVFVRTGSIDINITGNRFYQTGSRTQTTGSFHSAITIDNTSGNNYTVTGNTIGYASANGTGVYTLIGTTNTIFECISLNVGTTTASTIQGNTIARISMSGSQNGNFTNAPLKGINVVHGLVNIGNVTGNTIGNMTSTGNITYTSSSASASAVIGISLADSSNLTVNNNSIGGITASNSASGPANIWGIRSVTTGILTCQNNMIGGTVANSIRSNSTSTSTIVNGIENSGSTSTISSNTIRNITAASGTTASGYSAPIAGIMCNVSNFNQTISQNTIHTITNTDNSNATVTAGIYLSSASTANLVERNFIHSFNANSTSGSIIGIYANGGTADYQNNMIRLGIDAAGSSVASCLIRGINETSGTNDFHFNSIYIGGTASSGNSNSFAFNSTVTGNTRRYRNNIFFNARSNSGGSGKHFAIAVGGTSPLPPGLFSNYNILYVNGSGTVLGLFNSTDQPNLASWQTATGRDANSISADPVFADPDGNSSLVNLHIADGYPTPCESAGLLVSAITNDFDGQTRSTLTPTDIGADAGNFIDQMTPDINYTLLTNQGIGNVSFNNVTINDVSGVNGTAGTRPRCYYKKNTNANTFVDNTNSTNGWKYVEAAGSSSPFNFTINASLISGGLLPGDSVQYFVTAQDLASTPNVGINSGTYASVPASVNLTAAAFPIGGSINSYKVDVISVTGALSGNGAYPTLASAFSAINGASQSGANIIISISGNTTEPVTGAVLNSGSWANILIQPAGGQQRTLSAAVNPGSALINFNGADYVTIDGINSGGNSLTLSNTTVSSAWGTSTIRFENKTNNNVVTRCSVLGSSTSKSAGANIYFGSTTAPGPGNNYNSISYCNIGPAGTNLPASGVTSFGTSGSSAYWNIGDTIRNCNIYDYFNATDSSSGIYLPYYNSGFVIKDNKFYQTSPRIQTTGAPHAAVSILWSYGNNNFTISGNTIGYSSSSGTGTYSFTGVTNSIFYGISAEYPFATSVDIQNNTIAGISISGSLTMESVKFINVLQSLSANITGNVIGSVTLPGSITYNSNSYYNMISGIYCDVQNSATVNSNTIGSITASNSDPSGGCQIYAIRINAPTAACNYNQIGGRIPNSIYAATTSENPNTSVYGISCNPTATLSGNTITNLTSVGGNSGGVYPQVVGISGGSTISQNFIYGLSCSALNGRMVGIAGSGIISRNLIHSFSSPDTATTIIGITCGASNTVQNNMIRLGLDTSGNSMNTGCTIYGMYDDNGSNFYFNSIYIGGTATSGTSSTFCFKSTVLNSPRNYLNNIFCNVRTNNLTSVNHYAIGIDYTSGMNSDYNILFAPNTGGKTGLFNGSEQNNLAAWRTSTNQDNNSHAKDPQFLNPTTDFFFGLLISGAATPVEQNGIPVSGVVDDFYGATRSSLTPTDIGAHAGNFIQSVPLAGDYTVGLSFFNLMAGTNIYFEKKIKKVLKELEETDNSPEGSLNDGSVRMVMKEAEEEAFVPMQNGEIYTGPLFIKRSDHPELPADAMAGIFANINTALNELYSSGASAPVRFLLIDTSFTNEALPIFIGKWSNASVTNTLTIKPQAGVTSTISGNSSAIFDINTAAYFILDGSNTSNGTTKDLTVANSSGSGSAIRFINDARGNTVKNCILRGNSTSTANGIVSFLTTSGTGGNDSNLVQNNDITANSGQPNYGLYNSGSGSTSDQKNSHNRIIGNRIYDFAIRGITDEGNSAATLYERNEIYSVTPMTTRGAGFRTSASTIEGFTFRNNIIHDLKTSGIIGNDWIYGIELAGIQNSFSGEIYNNFISLSHQTSIDLRGISDRSPGYASYNIYFNSINISGPANAGTNSASYFRVNGASINFQNNILVNTRAGGINYAIRTSDTLNNFNCNYNNFYSAGSNHFFGIVGTLTIGNLADWRSATGKDSNSISANPLFISNTDLHIDSTLASPVSNKGLPVAGITTDYDSNTRSLTTPDIGADEFNGAYFPVNLDLTMFIEGFYDSSSDAQISDTLKVYLKNSVSPYANVDSAMAVAAANGLCSLAFANASSGSYYIVLTHRNSIQTWSSNAVAFTNGSTTAYNFTSAATQAYGDNMKQVDSSPTRFAIYSGDVNQDGVVDGTDASLIDNDASNFVTGYLITDLNGDEIIDGSDASIADNNAANFVGKITP